MKSIIPFTILVLTFSFSSCKKDSVDDDSVFLEMLRSSPDSVFVGTNSFGVEAFLWRDFMPVTEQNGDPLRSLVKLQVGDNQILPENVIMMSQYVINGDNYWTADFDDVRNNSQTEIEGLSSDGPKWGPDIQVDVVLEFALDGELYRVMDRNQEIIRTE